MRNKKDNKHQKYKLDASYDNHKYNFQKNSIKSKNHNMISKNIFFESKKINNNNTFQNINRNKSYLNKGNTDELNTNKINLLHIQKNSTNSKLSKNRILNYQNTPLRRDCYTPDKNINNLKYNIGISTHKKDSKNSFSLLKQNMHKNQSFIEYHYKNSSKKYLTRAKNNYNNNLSNERKKALTPDKTINSRNIKFNNNHTNFGKYGENKKIKEPLNYSNLSQNQFMTKFSKSYNNSNSTDNYNLLNNSSISNHFSNGLNRKKSNDNYMNYNNPKFNTRLSKGAKLPVLTNISKDKFSRSFCSHNHGKKNFSGKKEKYLFSNLKLNKTKNEFRKIYSKNNFSRVIARSKSTDSKIFKKNNSNNKFLFKKDNNHCFKHNLKNKNMKGKLVNNVSYDHLSKNYNINNNKLMNQNNFHNTFYLSQKMGNFNMTQNNKIKYYDINNMAFNKMKINGNNGLNMSDYNTNNNININSNTFLEMAQQKLKNKKIFNQKNYKNNLGTKSSTNTYDDINSSNSNVSRNNKILDSIEEIHFNFVNVVQSSRNLMKIQESIEGEKILNNNPNSTVIIVEERDIE